ncbi:porin [Stigmatella sp. ncwal1]|uniref:Porin n=1 Tax=Stigmatella ashevillensis TaxID=2995309 RepID=A0ABT5D6J5_9BACT|nr:porin [Stigmatella ashevillena]MDC0709287.1 porin [Stigmatella ashevillena]
MTKARLSLFLTLLLATTLPAWGQTVSSPPAPGSQEPTASAPAATAEPVPAPTPTPLPAPPPPPASPAPTITAEPGRGILVKGPGDRYSLGIRARIQFRDTFLHFDQSDTNEINIRTLRLTVHGNVLSPDLRYTIQLAFGGNDFETGSSSPIFDAFVDYTRYRDLNIRVGQFFVPFDRARTIREFALQMVDRQQVVRELTLDRDVGVMFSSTNLFGLHEWLGYNLFIGGGDGRNRFTAYEAGPIAVLRLTLRPFGTFDDDQEGDLTRAARPRLTFGLAGAYNYRTSRRNSTYGTAFTAGTVNYTNLAADLVFKYRGFSLLAEGLWRKASEDVLEGTVNGTVTREPTRSGYGYFVQGGFLVSPTVELTARWEELFARHGTDPQLHQLVQTQGKQVGGGANVYLNGHAFKLQGDYFYIFGPEGEPRHLARIQLDASF